MVDLLIAVVIIAVLIGFPTVIYLVISQYHLGHRLGEWWFKRHNAFPDQPNKDETRRMAMRKKH
jgi:hypothetical protein